MTGKYPDLPQVIDLRGAYLCVNCSVVVDSASRCWACGSVALLSLARVLGSLDAERIALRVSEDDDLRVAVVPWAGEQG